MSSPQIAWQWRAWGVYCRVCVFLAKRVLPFTWVDWFMERNRWLAVWAFQYAPPRVVDRIDGIAAQRREADGNR